MKHSGKSELAVYKGFYVAALVPAISLSALSPGLGVSLTDPLSLVAWSALLYIPSLAFVGLFGIPCFVLLRRINLIRWWSAAFAGYLSALAVWSALVGFNWSQQELLSFFSWSSIGTVSAIIIWAFWRASEGAAQQGVQADRTVPTL